MDAVIRSAKRAIKDRKERKAFYEPVFEAFRDHDCDTLYECKGADPAFDDVLREVYGDDDEG